MTAQAAMAEPFSLAHTDFFHGLDVREASAVAALGRVRVVRAGRDLFSVGEPAKSLFVVREGAVRVSMPLTVHGETRDIRLELATPNATLGWSALSPPYVFTCSARAMTHAVLLAFSRDRLHALMEADPRIGCALRSNIISMLGGRLWQMQGLWIRQVQRALVHNVR
jgi:CRP-like cAMP-binding protein